MIACEWKPVQIEQVYPDLNELITVFRSFSAFVEDHERVTGNMLTIINNLDITFNNIGNVGFTFSVQLKNVLKSFEAYYNSTIEDRGTLDNKINCLFVKHDLITFNKQLYSGFSRVIQISTATIICSLVAYFTSIMLIIYISSLYEKKDSKNIIDDEVTELIQKDNWQT